ncbi:MAG: signal peptidase II [Anaerolineales bacterium]|nr:signal peptidase II [Anaerolineales bacterium]
MNKVKNYLFLLGVAGIVIALDQWTKWWVRQNIGFGEILVPFDWMAPYARFIHWNNTGAAFGMFPAGATVFKIIAVIVIAAILYYYPMVPYEKWLYKIALGMQLGGATGNLIDRLTQGGPVTDFISVGNFAVFNLADSGISVGVALLVLAMWLDERKAARQETVQEAIFEHDSELAENSGASPQEIES